MTSGYRDLRQRHGCEQGRLRPCRTRSRSFLGRTTFWLSDGSESDYKILRGAGLLCQRYRDAKVFANYQFVADLQLFEILWVPRFDRFGCSIHGFHCHSPVRLIDRLNGDKQSCQVCAGTTGNSQGLVVHSPTVVALCTFSPGFFLRTVTRS